MKDLVSIITPLYNSVAYLPDMIESVLSQTYYNWELLIVDDASSDNSVEIVESYSKTDDRIKLICFEKNSGAAISRNKAIEEAKGRYIAFLDSDDLWSAEKLEKQIIFMKDHDVALSYTSYYSIDEVRGKVIGEVPIPRKVNYHELLKQNIIGCLTAMYDVGKLGKVYMPNIRKRQDFALWLKILKQVPYAYGINEPLAYYRIRQNSISNNKLKASLYNWKMYRDIEKLPLHKAIYYFGWYTYKSILKYK